MSCYKIRNWHEFQHYKDRNPPWIKLHYEVMTSRDWVALDDASRVLAVASMLIASRHDGTVPDDPDYVRRVAYLNSAPDFRPLVKCGFLVADGCAVQPQTPEQEAEGRDRDRDRGASDALAHDSKPSKKPYGEFGGVKLSDEEHAKLTARHGAARLAKGIAILDDYMRSKGKRYKDHYATLKETSWVWKRVDEAGGKPTAPKLVNTWHDPNPDMAMRKAF
jgi:hypothetical protein